MVWARDLHVPEQIGINPVLRVLGPLGQEPKYAAHVAAVNARDGGAAFSTSKREMEMEMENYVHPQAIVEAYQANGVGVILPDAFGDFDDVPLIVAEALHTANAETLWAELPEEKRKKKSSKAKRVINGDAARRMSVERLLECGGYDEVLMWFQTIKELIET